MIGRVLPREELPTIGKPLTRDRVRADPRGRPRPHHALRVALARAAPARRTARRVTNTFTVRPGIVHRVAVAWKSVDSRRDVVRDPAEHDARPHDVDDVDEVERHRPVVLRLVRVDERAANALVGDDGRRCLRRSRTRRRSSRFTVTRGSRAMFACVPGAGGELHAVVEPDAPHRPHVRAARTCRSSSPSSCVRRRAAPRPNATATHPSRGSPRACRAGRRRARSWLRVQTVMP